MVFFDAAEIRAIVEKLAAEVGLPADLAITVDIDETTPMGRSLLQSLDPVVLSLESRCARGPEAAPPARRSRRHRRARSAALRGARPARPRLR